MLESLPVLSHPSLASRLSFFAVGDLSTIIFSPIPSHTTLTVGFIHFPAWLHGFPNVLGLCCSTPPVHALKFDFSLEPSAGPALHCPLEEHLQGSCFGGSGQFQVKTQMQDNCQTSLPLSVTSPGQGSRQVNPQPAMEASGCLSRWVQDVQPWKGCCH